MNIQTITPDSGRQVFWLCRHGMHAGFVDRNSKGHDPRLAPVGVVQAKEAARRLRGEKIRHIISSPFVRCVETAFQIAEALDLPIQIEDGAGEWLNPDWTSEAPVCLTPAKLQELFPRVDLSYQSAVQRQWPESLEKVRARCRQTAASLVRHFHSDILVVGHGASVVGLTYAFLEAEPPLDPATCSLTKIVRQNGSATLELVDDVTHLSGGAVRRPLWR